MIKPSDKWQRSYILNETQEMNLLLFGAIERQN